MIKDLKRWLVGAWIGISLQPAHAENSVNLKQAFELALNHNESIQIQEEVFNQSAETARQAVGSVLPTLTGTAQYVQTAIPNSSIAGSLYPNQQPLIRMTLNQPIFQGFAEYAGLRQTKILKENQKILKSQTKLTLYNSLAQNFFSIVSQENDLKNLHREIGYYDQQIQELKKRVSIGKSQVSDVLTTESYTAGLKAQVEAIQGQIAANRETFGFLTGLSPGTVLVDQTQDPPEPGPIALYLAQREQRPDIQSYRLLADSSHEGITIANAGHWPTVNAFGNYYFLRFGSASDINWDFGIALTLPIFSGGNVQSRVRAAAALERQSLLVLSQSERQASAFIKAAYETLKADQAQLRAFKMGSELSEKNYFELVRQFKLGLVININLLTSLASFQETKRSLDRMRYQVKLDWSNLQAAIGKFPERGKE